MKIQNAKIKNVARGMDSKKCVCVSLEFHYSTHFKIVVFKLENPVELANFKKLLEFAEATNFESLEGKIIRVAEHKDVVKAVGDPIEDKFIDITNTIMMDLVKEMSISELLKEYPET